MTEHYSRIPAIRLRPPEVIAAEEARRAAVYKAAFESARKDVEDNDRDCDCCGEPASGVVDGLFGAFLPACYDCLAGDCHRCY